MKVNQRVMFKRSFSPYSAGEIAGFVPGKAKALVDAGVAVYTNPEDDGVTVNRQTTTEVEQSKLDEPEKEQADTKTQPKLPPGRVRQRGRNRQIITDDE